LAGRSRGPSGNHRAIRWGTVHNGDDQTVVEEVTVHEMNQWLAHERARELRLQADELHRARREGTTRVRSLLRRLRTER
jgi:hypothetical protein